MITEFLLAIIAFAMVINILSKISRDKIRLDVQDPWYSWIVSGQKTIEGRPGFNGKHDIMLGKTIMIYRTNNPLDVVWMRVVCIRHFTSLDEYLHAEEHSVAHDELSMDEIKSRYLAIKDSKGRQVFGDESIAKKGGINALKLEFVNNIWDKMFSSHF